MKHLYETWKQTLRERKALVRIIALFLTGSILLLTFFSAVLTWYLTARTTQVVLSSSKNSVNQAYNAASFMLSDAYDSYYKVYQSLEMQHAMFGAQHTVDDKLSLLELFDSAQAYNACVESIYVVNKSLDTVYTNQGYVSSLADFYDAQALRLFEFYNENSTTVFLPRNVSFGINGAPEGQHNYITLIFALKNKVSTVMGGLIVNIDESKLHSLITADLANPEHMYIVSANGSILAHSDPAAINTTLQGTSLWAAIAAGAPKRELEFETVFQGVESLVTYKKSDKLLFGFVNIVPKSEIAENVSYIRTFVVVVFTLFLGVALLVAFLCGQSIYTPISRLVYSLKTRTSHSEGTFVPMDEFSFLDKAYQSLCAEVEDLNGDKEELSRAKLRECLVSLLRGKFGSEENCTEAIKPFSALSERSYHLVVIIAFDDFATMVNHNTQQDLALLKYAIFNVANELLAHIFSLQSIDVSEKYLTVLLSSDTCDDATLQTIRTALERVAQVMYAHLHFKVSSGIGTFTSTLTQIPKSNANAFTALGYRLVMGQQAVVAYLDIALRQGLSCDYPAQEEADLIAAVRSCNETKAMHALDCFFTRIGMANPDSIHMAVSQLSIALTRVVKSLSVDKEIESQFNFRTVSVRLTDCDCLAQRKEILYALCEQVIQSRSREVQSKRGELVERICEFLQNNYANPLLSIDDIAAYAQLSANYLRTTFKAATGRSPTDYLSDVRIEKACEFLTTTDYATKDIATATGYYNHRYFYSVFKSKMGQTATEYRSAKASSVAQKEGLR